MSRQFLSAVSLTGGNTITNTSSTVLPLYISGAASQTADLLQLTSSTPTVLGGSNAVAQTYTGSTTPIIGTASTITQTVVTAGTNVVYTTSAAHNYGVGDLVTITGITTAQGLPATSPVVITAVATTTFTAAVTTGTSGTYTSLTGSSTIPVQASITARSAGTVGLAIRGASGQATSLLSLSDSAGSTVARITQAGNIQATNLQTLNGLVTIGEENSGARVRLTSATTTPTAFATGGTIYTQSGALRYLGSSGTGQTLIGGDGSNALSTNRLLADSAANTATSLQNIFPSGSSTLTVEPNTTYAFRLFGVVNRGSATASTLSVRLTMSATPSFFKSAAFTMTASSGTALHASAYTATEAQVDISTTGGSSTVALRFCYEGSFTTSATASQTVIPQWIQSANASSVMQAGTYFELIKVGAPVGAWA